MHAADQDDIASGLRVAEAEYRLQRAGGGDEDGKKMDANHNLALTRSTGEVLSLTRDCTIHATQERLHDLGGYQPLSSPPTRTCAHIFGGVQ